MESFLGLLVSKGVVDERHEDSFDFNGRTKQDLVQWCVSFDGQRTVTTVIEHPDQSEKSAGYDEDYPTETISANGPKTRMAGIAPAAMI